jgi:hypothetical protein
VISRSTLIGGVGICAPPGSPWSVHGETQGIFIHQCVFLSHFVVFIVTDIVAPSQVHHNCVGNPCQLVLMPALKSITRFSLPKQPNMRDGQVTKDFLESVHEILNEWHLIEFVLRNVTVLNRINLFVLEFGTWRKF